MPKSVRLATLSTLLAATPALAQEGEGGLLDINTGLMVWTILIFLIVLAVLYRTAYPAILGAVEARETHIRELLEAAARDRRAAAEHLREEMLAEARREQQALLARAQRDIRQESEAVLTELRAQTVDVAIAAASKLIARNLDESDNRRLVTDFLSGVELRDGGAVRARG
jgi:F-type H+-transporting ATPase subunit b